MVEIIRIELSCSWFIFSICCQILYQSITHPLQSWLLSPTYQPQIIFYLRLCNHVSFVHKLSYFPSLVIIGFCFDNIFYSISFIINGARIYFENKDILFSNKINKFHAFSSSYYEESIISISLLNVEEICTIVLLDFFINKSGLLILSCFNIPPKFALYFISLFLYYPSSILLWEDGLLFQALLL